MMIPNTARYNEESVYKKLDNCDQKFHTSMINMLIFLHTFLHEITALSSLILD